jgi:hypothetical protein
VDAALALVGLSRLPTIGLVIWLFTPWVGLVALVVGLASGVVVLRIGIR